MNFLIWYVSGIIGTFTASKAFDSGCRANNYDIDPWTIGSIIKGGIFSLLGPIAIFGACIWWVSAFFEWYPIWRWKWIQPLKKIWQKSLHPKPD